MFHRRQENVEVSAPNQSFVWEPLDAARHLVPLTADWPARWSRSRTQFFSCQRTQCKDCGVKKWYQSVCGKCAKSGFVFRRWVLTRWVHFVGVRRRRWGRKLMLPLCSSASAVHSGWIPDETTHGHIGQLDSQLLQAKKVIDKKIIGQTATGN